MRASVGLQKFNFVHVKTLHPGTSHPRNAVLQKCTDFVPLCYSTWSHVRNVVLEA